ncbi:hypothetical protein PAHAL_8G037600 [Panicum hallii]|jgi:hypothetical protein|uniref:FAF domain-containing protein n=1 Tax=Panicum hallii TaxID=206008 RepID=A0A2S3ICK5_9POAL|nr:protein FAF-like, chloroplastic [Panicum hallii]PAN41361.1 hypothetical protein PAHAL_8G037600 [Panicum hallii]PAN41362.1 hypothetical protein PAHAL_8G037600 [Panicum hallii]PAN41363.1 hypothetical protein PAHAL_8G037600 [Panicum hallii]PVH33642.1 hypothetical protein PAHAL_8G037600 [Panicum hallii]
MFSREKQLIAAPMASDSGLRRLFEKPLPENPTLLEALSAWNRNTHPNKPIDPSSFTEIFGELHFQEKQPERAVLPQAPAPASWLDIATAAEAEKSKDDSSLDALLRPKPAASAVATVKRSASFCLKKSSASLLLCTEGLGSESTVDADDMFKDGDAEAEAEAEAAALKGAETDGRDGDAAGDAEAMKGEEEKERQPKTFPPPIRSIGRGGKPYVCFRSFREGGRFVLLEVVIPGKELLQATRDGGRLRLRFANAAAAAGAGADEVVPHGEDDHHQAAKSACIDDDES